MTYFAFNYAIIMLYILIYLYMLTVNNSHK